MGIHYYVVPLETVGWNDIWWENIDLKEAKKFIKKNPMPKNDIYRNEKELLEDIRYARGVIAFRVDCFKNKENEKFFEWFAELIYECLA